MRPNVGMLRRARWSLLIATLATGVLVACSGNSDAARVEEQLTPDSALQSVSRGEFRDADVHGIELYYYMDTFIDIDSSNNPVKLRDASWVYGTPAGTEAFGQVASAKFDRCLAVLDASPPAQELIVSHPLTADVPASYQRAASDKRATLIQVKVICDN